MHPRSNEIVTYGLFINGTAIAMNGQAAVTLADGGKIDGMDISDAIGAVTIIDDVWEFELFGCGLIRTFDSRPTYAELALCAVTALVSIGLDASRMEYILASYGDYLSSGGSHTVMN